MKITSAVPGMTVVEVRKIMHEVRNKLDNVSEFDPFIMNERLSNHQTIADFVFSVATGLHNKRTKKRVDKNDNDTIHKNK